MKFFLALTLLAVLLIGAESTRLAPDATTKNFYWVADTSLANELVNVWMPTTQGNLYVIYHSSHRAAYNDVTNGILRNLGNDFTTSFFCYLVTDEVNKVAAIPGNEKDYWTFWKDGKVARTEKYELTEDRVRYIVEEMNNVTPHSKHLGAICY